MKQNKKMETPDNLTSNGYRFRTTTSDENWEPVAFVNATPDSGYVRRILEAHLLNNEQGRMVGIGGSELIAEVMDKAQEDRAALIRKALDVINAEAASQK